MTGLASAAQSLRHPRSLGRIEANDDPPWGPLAQAGGYSLPADEASATDGSPLGAAHPVVLGARVEAVEELLPRPVPTMDRAITCPVDGLLRHCLVLARN